MDCGNILSHHSAIVEAVVIVGCRGCHCWLQVAVAGIIALQVAVAIIIGCRLERLLLLSAGCSGHH